MKHITYKTEKIINKIKKKELFERTMQENLIVWIWDDIFAKSSYLGATLKEFENYLGYKLDNTRQENVPYLQGIHGIEYMTQGNVKYVGTHDLSHLNINDFNEWAKEIEKGL